MDKNIYLPLFSVIVPAYNASNYIEKCIISVLNQEYENFELIIVDDGSTDGTFDICCAYGKKDSRIKIIKQANGGHTSARNAGLSSSCGEYVFFLDSDDWFDLNVLSGCESIIRKYEPDLITFDIKDSDGKIVGSCRLQEGIYEINKNNDCIMSSLILDENGKYIFPRSLSGKCFKRTLIYESQMNVPSKIRIGEDGAAFVSATMKAKSIYVMSGMSYNCFIHGDSVSHTSDADAFKRLPYLLDYLNEVTRCNEFDFEKQIDRYIVAKLFSAAQFVRRSGKKSSYLDEQYREIIKDKRVEKALQNAHFSIRGYKYLMKKMILTNKLWCLIK